MLHTDLSLTCYIHPQQVAFQPVLGSPAVRLLFNAEMLPVFSCGVLRHLHLQLFAFDDLSTVLGSTAILTV